MPPSSVASCSFIRSADENVVSLAPFGIGIRFVHQHRDGSVQGRAHGVIHDGIVGGVVLR